MNDPRYRDDDPNPWCRYEAKKARLTEKSRAPREYEMSLRQILAGLKL